MFIIIVIHSADKQETQILFFYLIIDGYLEPKDTDLEKMI